MHRQEEAIRQLLGLLLVVEMATMLVIIIDRLGGSHLEKRKNRIATCNQTGLVLLAHSGATCYQFQPRHMASTT